MWTWEEGIGYVTGTCARCVHHGKEADEDGKRPCRLLSKPNVLLKAVGYHRYSAAVWTSPAFGCNAFAERPPEFGDK